jgi:hypothetical protein
MKVASKSSYKIILEKPVRKSNLYIIPEVIFNVFSIYIVNSLILQGWRSLTGH